MKNHNKLIESLEKRMLLAGLDDVAESFEDQDLLSQESVGDVVEVVEDGQLAQESDAKDIALLSGVFAEKTSASNKLDVHLANLDRDLQARADLVSSIHNTLSELGDVNKIATDEANTLHEGEIQLSEEVERANAVASALDEAKQAVLTLREKLAKISSDGEMNDGELMNPDSAAKRLLEQACEIDGEIATLRKIISGLELAIKMLVDQIERTTAEDQLAAKTGGSSKYVTLRVLQSIAAKLKNNDMASRVELLEGMITTSDNIKSVAVKVSQALGRPVPAYVCKVAKDGGFFFEETNNNSNHFWTYALMGAGLFAGGIVVGCAMAFIFMKYNKMQALNGVKNTLGDGNGQWLGSGNPNWETIRTGIMEQSNRAASAVSHSASHSGGDGGVAKTATGVLQQGVAKAPKGVQSVVRKVVNEASKIRRATMSGAEARNAISPLTTRSGRQYGAKKT